MKISKDPRIGKAAVLALVVPTSDFLPATVNPLEPSAPSKLEPLDAPCGQLDGADSQFQEATGIDAPHVDNHYHFSVWSIGRGK